MIIGLCDFLVLIPGTGAVPFVQASVTRRGRKNRSPHGSPAQIHPIQIHSHLRMKLSHLTLAAVLALALPLSVHAAKDPAKKEAKRALKDLMSQYDKNSNGSIDADEADALKKAFEADKTGPLKKFDINADGKLDDTEIAAIHGGKKKGEKADKKNKAA